MSAPVLGYYVLRLRPHGPPMPVRIWEAGERDETGAPMSDIMLCAEVAGRPAPAFDCWVRHRVWINVAGASELADCPGCVECEERPGAVITTVREHGMTTERPPGHVFRSGVWPRCQGHEIDEAEYRYLIDDTAWVSQYEPTDPRATPHLVQGQAKRTAEARRAIYERINENVE